ncbi:phosphosulfolactate synthase [Desulfuribacillus alkaliarsenatis]|uniref:Phosphosulfolactate synthase n=1 Tax=Desulfuribacillus alkaliarsenatis TaxID=766136 RepID=A0A1E5G5P3_9FIRM|nr:phosphosulfolactate synthase [Desulfuribacillus alkaliarsenatis]OEF98425.1 hypothetical protein BHF68_01755 [Desulfuribacillus alkaliarsenatis]
MHELGKTMIIDKGIGISQIKDMLTFGKAHLDFLKYGFGTSCLYEPISLIEKNELLTKSNVICFPGGTLFEAAYYKNMVNSFFDDILKYSFTGVEISHGTIDVDDMDRHNYIRRAKQMQLTVFSELGKKNETGFKDIIESVKRDLDAGSDYVVLEGRETGTSGLYNKEGAVADDILNIFEAESDLLPYIIWEAPCMEQQILLLKHFGANVNIGNVAFQDVLSLAALRRGLRSDTFFDFLS